MNIDYQNDGYFLAASPIDLERRGFGGAYHSDNLSKSIPVNITAIPGKLQVIIDTSKKTTWQGYDGMKVFVVNTTADTIFFDAQDSRLYMVLQAKDVHGEWRDIEYLAGSWCGNSYMQLFLSAHLCWEFNAPLYHGEIQTKLRAQLSYKKTAGQKEPRVLYSNEINAGINPGQFWNVIPYAPTELMDPYEIVDFSLI